MYFNKQQHIQQDKHLTASTRKCQPIKYLTTFTMLLRSAIKPTQLHMLLEAVIIQSSHLGKTVLTEKPGCSPVWYFPFILNMVHL